MRSANMKDSNGRQALAISKTRLLLWTLLLMSGSLGVKDCQVSAAASHPRPTSREQLRPEVTTLDDEVAADTTVIPAEDAQVTATAAAVEVAEDDWAGNAGGEQDVVDNDKPAEGETSSEDQAPIVDRLADEPLYDEVAELRKKQNSMSSDQGKKYSFIKAVCDDRHMTIEGTFKDLFHGRIYALGYPDEAECGFTTLSNPEVSPNVTFSLPLGRCGVSLRTKEEEEGDKPKTGNTVVFHDASIYIQYSAFLQQSVDEKLSLSCLEQKNLNTDGVWTGQAENLFSSETAPTYRTRRGRKLKDVGVKTGMPKLSNKVGEAWMEIIAGKDPAPKSKKHSPVNVGEDVTIVISAKVNRGFDARIVNCSAHDGSRSGSEGSRAQQLLDSAGCSVDKSLVPNFRRRRLPVETRNRLTTLHFATFPAFKFPERDHLHIKCSVAYCQGPCPQEACDSGKNHFGTWKDKYGRLSQVLIESSDIVNSVEVIAPDLEETGGHHYERHQSAGSFPLTDSPSSSMGSGRGFSSDAASSLFFAPAISSPVPTSSAGGAQGYQQQPSPTTLAHNGGQLHQQQQQQHYWSKNSMPPPPPQSQPVNGIQSVCISPGTVILALVILGIILVISATVTLWFALKRSELKKMHLKHHSFHSPSPGPYYRFSQHW